METLEQYPCFDFGIAGEGEIALVALIDALCDGHQQFSVTAGLVYREHSTVIYNPVERISDIDALPLPSWHLFPGVTVYNMITTRGCLFITGVLGIL